MFCINCYRQVLKDEVTKPSIEDHLDGPDLGMVQDGQVSTGLKEPTSFL